MALGSVRKVGAYKGIQPVNYSLKNKSSVSRVYVEAVTKPEIAAGAVDPASPVAYPTAQKVVKARIVAAGAAGKVFNKVADSFQGMTTGYRNDGQGVKYQTVGENIDIFV
jgi:hypothetical protein